MMGTGPRFSFVILAVICFANSNVASSVKVTNGETTVFNYFGKTGVGVTEPKYFISEYTIKGKLLVKPWSNSDVSSGQTLVLALNDLKHTSNYENKDHDVAENLSADDESQLGKAFLVDYNNDGLFQAIKFQEGETDVSKKIKKSIASLLDFDTYSIRDRMWNKRVIDEDTLYGKCKVKYDGSVYDNPIASTGINLDEHLIKKKYTPKECSNFVHDVRGYFDSSEDFNTRIQEQLHTVGEHRISIDNTTEELFIKYAVKNELYEWRMDNKPENTNKHIVKTEQSIHFDRTVRKSEILDQLKNSMFVDHDTSLSLNRKESQDNVAAVSKINMDDRMMKINILLSKAEIHMQNNHLVKFQPGMENEQVFNNLLSLIEDMNIEQLEHLYHNITSNTGSDTSLTKSIITYLISHIGSKATTTFILNLIISKKVSDDDAVQLLTICSTYIRQPTKETLSDFEVFFDEEKQLPVQLKKTSILAFSHIISKVFPHSEVSDDDEVLLHKYLNHFRNATKHASNVEMKLVNIFALGNTRNRGAVKYLLQIIEMTERENMERILPAVMFALSKTMDETRVYAFESLQAMIMDNSIAESIKISIYDVLINKPGISQKEVNQIHQIMMDNDNLRNYHISHIKNLQKANILPEVMTKIAENINQDVTYSLSVEKTFDQFSFAGSLYPGFPTSYKLSYAVQNNMPVQLRFENLDKIGNKYTEIFGIYGNTNYDKLAKINNDGGKIYENMWISWANWVIDVQSNETTVNDQIEPIEILSQLQENLMHYLNTRYLVYIQLTSFSVPTSFGWPATFEHKLPAFWTSKFNIDKKIKTPKIIVDLSFDLVYWLHGYSGIKFENSLTGLTQSVKTSSILDIDWKYMYSFVYDFTTSEFKIILPIVNPTYKVNQGIAGHTSTNVMITQNDKLISDKLCKDCGYQTVSMGKKNLLDKSDVRESNLLGLKISHVVYDLDISFDPLWQRLLHKTNALSSAKIYQIGYLVKIEPNSLETLSQLELTISSFIELFEKPEPKYLLPGFASDLHLKLSGKRTIDNQIVDIGGIRGGLNYSLGQTFLEFRANLYKVYGEQCMTSPTPCDYVHAKLNSHYAVYSLSEISSQQILSQSKIHNYIVSSVDDRETSLYNITTSVLLANNTQCLCGGEKRNFFFLYPHQSFPTSTKCLIDFITNPALTVTESDTSSVQIDQEMMSDSIIKIFAMIRINDQLKKMMHPSQVYQPKLEFKTEYPISSQLTKEYVEDLKTSSKAYQFKTEDAKLITILPGIIINEKNETYVAELKKWEKVLVDDEGSYTIFAKVLESQKLALRIEDHSQGNENNHYLNLEPTDPNIEYEANQQRICDNVSKKTDISFDGQTVGYSDKNVILPVNEKRIPNICSFSVHQSDKFIRIKLKSNVVIVYYTPNIITIAYKNYKDATYYWECDKE